MAFERYSYIFNEIKNLWSRDVTERDILFCLYYLLQPLRFVMMKHSEKLKGVQATYEFRFRRNPA